MSLAWEVTVEDVAFVLGQHGLSDSPDQVFEKCFVENVENCTRVEQAALADFDDRCDAALDEIEAILM